MGGKVGDFLFLVWKIFWIHDFDFQTVFPRSGEKSWFLRLKSFTFKIVVNQKFCQKKIFYQNFADFLVNPRPISVNFWKSRGRKGGKKRLFWSFFMPKNRDSRKKIRPKIKNRQLSPPSEPLVLVPNFSLRW